jgi:hypothetical protein
MDLYGADRDMTNFLEWLTGDEKFPNLKISSIHNTSRTDIVSKYLLLFYSNFFSDGLAEVLSRELGNT